MDDDKDREVRWKKFVFLAILVVLFYVLLDSGGGRTESKEFVGVIIWGFVLLSLVRDNIKVPLVPSLFGLLFFLWGGVSAFFTYSPDMSFRALLEYGTISGTFILAYSIATDENREKFTRILSFTFIVMLVIGYFFLIGARVGIFTGRHDMLRHFISTFFWKNPAAGYIGMWLPVAFVLWRVSEKAKLFWAIVFVLGVCAFILTRSRGGWVAFLVAIMFSAPFGWRFLKEHIKPASVLVVVAFALSLVIMPPNWVIQRFSQMKEIAKEKTSEPVEERREMLKMGIRGLKKHPITGVGIGAFACAYPSLLGSSHYLSRHLHNQYLQTAVETGILGMVFFSLSIFISVGLLLFYAMRRLDILLWSIGVGTLSFAIHIALDFDWEFWGASLAFASLLGIAMPKDQRTIDISGVRRILAIVVVLFGFFSAIVVSAAGAFNTVARNKASLESVDEYVRWSRLSVKLYPFSTTFRVQLADGLSLLGDKDGALRELERAYSLEPKNPVIGYAYGFAIINLDIERAISVIEKANSLSPYSLPDRKLGYARTLMSIKNYARAAEILREILTNFSTNPDERYSEKTSSIRYYVAQAANELGYICLSKNEYTQADSLFRLVQVLGCPRQIDGIAHTWGIDTPSPEAIVAQLYDALNVGDTIRAWSLIRDNIRPQLPADEKIYLVQVLESHQDMIKGEAKVQVLLALTKEAQSKIDWNVAEFKLTLTEDGWRIMLGE